MYGTSPQPISHKEGMQISFESILLWCILLMLSHAMNSCTSMHLLAPLCSACGYTSYSPHVLAGMTPGAHKVLTVKVLVCSVSIC